MLTPVIAESMSPAISAAVHGLRYLCKCQLFQVFLNRMPQA